MEFYDIRGLKEWINDLGEFELYEELPIGERMKFHRGQFYTAHVKYPFSAPPMVLEIKEDDSDSEEDITFTISEYDKDSNEQTHIPIREIGLRSNERLYILKGKPRTVIVLGYVESAWFASKKEKLVLCLPVASFKVRHSFEDITAIQLFQIPHLFYIKPVLGGPDREGAARFELIQPVQVGELQPITNSKNLPFRLSSRGYKLILNQIAKFLCNVPLDHELEKDIKAYQELMNDELDGSE
jgi:hypothetical protein